MLLAVLGACANTSMADAAPTRTPVTRLAVTGIVPRPATFDVTELTALGAHEIEWAHHGTRSTYTVVALTELLQRCGLDGGRGGPDVDPREKHLGWRRVVRAISIDGFEAVFSSAELMPEVGPTRAFVAFARNGSPLDAGEGPLRLLVPTDGKGSRSVRRLARVEISAVP